MISSVSSASNSFLVDGTTTTQSGGLESQLDALTSAIESGDMDAIQSAYETLTENQPDNAGSGDDPIGQFLSSVEEALANGDTEALQEAADTFGSAEAPSAAGGPPPPPPEVMESETADSLTTLLDALSSGDEETATSSYETLLTALSANEEASATSSDEDNPLKSVMAEVGAALDEGDTETAMSLIEGALQDLPSGTLLSTSA